MERVPIRIAYRGMQDIANWALMIVVISGIFILAGPLLYLDELIRHSDTPRNIKIFAFVATAIFEAIFIFFYIRWYKKLFQMKIAVSSTALTFYLWGKIPVRILSKEVVTSISVNHELPAIRHAAYLPLKKTTMELMPKSVDRSTLHEEPILGLQALTWSQPAQVIGETENDTRILIDQLNTAGYPVQQV